MSREARVPGPGEVELRKLIPNILTAASLCAGLASLYYSMRGEFPQAIVAVMISFILDGLDGRMARLLRVTSRFGESFDSMADFMAFGVAPAFLVFQWQLKDAKPFAGVPVASAATETIGLAVCMLFALCSAIRLARFTANAGKPNKKPGAASGKFFAGLPAPAAGGAVLIPPMLKLSSLQFEVSPEVTAGLTALLAIFMVSKIPMMSVKGIKISRKLVSPILALVGLAVFGVMKDGWLTASVFFGLYLLTFPLGMLMYKRAVKKEASEAGLLSRQGVEG